MMDGWVKLHRQIVEKGWLRNHCLWSFWCYCLVKCTHQDTSVMIGYQRVEIKKGQFVFGRKKAAEDLGVTEKRIRTCVSNLVKMGNVAIKTANKFSIITVINWDTYQSEERPMGQQKGQQGANKGPTRGHIQEQEEQEEHKKLKTKAQAPCELPDWVPLDAWNGYREMRVKIRKPMTERAKSLAISTLSKLRSDGHDPEAVLNQSTLHAWQGLFAVKGDNLRSQQPKTFGQIREEETARVLRAFGEKLDNGQTDFFAGDGEVECGFSSRSFGAGNGNVSRGGLIVVK